MAESREKVGSGAASKRRAVAWWWCLVLVFGGGLDVGAKVISRWKVWRKERLGSIEELEGEGTCRS
jgi:hypothetical protein